MERTDILPPTNALELTNLANLSKASIIFSNKEYPPYYPITSTYSIIPETVCIVHYVMTDYVMSSAPAHDMQPARPGIAVTLTDGNKIISLAHCAFFTSIISQPMTYFHRTYFWLPKLHWNSL